MKKFNIITIIVSPILVTILGIGSLNNMKPPRNSTNIVNALPKINFKNS